MSDEAVLRLLEGTRTQHDHGDMRDVYLPHFDVIGSILRGSGVDCGFILSHSKHRQCEAIEIGGKHYIVYDQYMGQTLSTLNRFFFEKKPERAIVVYAHKLMGEFLLRHNRLEIALACGCLYAEDREIVKSDGTSHLPRAVCTAVQEFFVMAHEAAHLLFRHNDDLRQSTEERLDAYIRTRDERHQKLTKIPFRERYDLHPQEFRDKWIPEAEIAAMEKLHDPIREARQHQGTMSRLTGDTELREEMCCDYFAAVLTATSMGRRFPFTVRDILRAIYIASYHLRAIRTLDIACRRFLDGNGGERVTLENKEAMMAFVEGEHAWALQLRSHFMLFHCASLIETLNTPEWRADFPGRVAADDMNREQFNDELLAVQEHYYDVILDRWNSVIGYALLGRHLEDETARRTAKDSEFVGLVRMAKEIRDREGVATAYRYLCEIFGTGVVEFNLEIFRPR